MQIIFRSNANLRWSKFRLKKFTTAFNALEHPNVVEAAMTSACDGKFVDATKQKRLHRLAQFASEMETNVYKKYSEARRVSICSGSRRGYKHYLTNCER